MRRHNLASKIIATTLAVGLMLPSVAFADSERAAQFYQEATEAYQAGDLRKAADLLERAFAEDPDLVYQYNRILALEGLKDLDEALRVLEIYEEPMKRDDQKRFEDISEIRARLQQAKADLASKPEDKVEEKPDDKVEEKPVEKPEPVQPVDDGPNILAWSLIGAGAVSLGVGTVFGSGMLAGDAMDNVQCVDDGGNGSAALSVVNAPGVLESCYGEGSYAPNYQAYQDDKDTLSSHQAYTIIFLGAGAALATAGIVVWALDSDEAPRSESDDVPVSAGLTPYIGPNGAGAVLNVSF